MSVLRACTKHFVDTATRQARPIAIPRLVRYAGKVVFLAAAYFAAAKLALLAAIPPGYAGLVLFSYPLHPPGQPARTAARIAHWPAIECPVLLLSGEADPFARLALLREGVRTLPIAELVSYPRLGHTLKPVLNDVLDRVRAFVEGLPQSTESTR